MCVETALDFGGCDLKTFVFNEFLLVGLDIGHCARYSSERNYLDTIYSVEFSFSINGNISRCEPAISEGIFRGLVIAEISLCYNWAADDELSGSSYFNILQSR
jgi:hypothetical protein